jgi:hypothetical protein
MGNKVAKHEDDCSSPVNGKIQIDLMYASNASICFQGMMQLNTFMLLPLPLLAREPL